MNPSSGAPQQQPSIIDQLKSFLMGSGILHNLAGPDQAPGGQMQPMTPGPTSNNNRGLFAPAQQGVSTSQADAIAKQAQIQQAQAAALAAGGNPNAILAAPQRKRKATK